MGPEMDIQISTVMLGRTIQPILLQLACATGSGQWHVSQAGSFFGDEWLKHQLVLFLSEDPKNKMIQFSIPSIYTVLLTWGSCRDSNCSSTCTVPMGLPPRMASSLKSWRSFISRISCRGLIASTLGAEALQGFPALSVLYTVYTVYVNLCVYDVSLYAWRLFRRSDRHPQGFARNKASAQRRRGSDSQHCWTGLDSLWYFGHFWVLGLRELYLT